MWGDAVTQVLIPGCALVGIGFALFQWFLVSRVKVSEDTNGYHDNLIDNEDQEEGVDQLHAVIKCSEIQNAIAVGKVPDSIFKRTSQGSVFSCDLSVMALETVNSGCCVGYE